MAYTKLKYIESNGTQYIDTGFQPNKDTRIDMVVSALSVVDINGTDGFAAYGSGVSSNSNNIELYSYGNKTEIHYGKRYAYGVAISEGDLISITQNKNVVSIINESKGIGFNNTFPYLEITCPRSLYLFAIYQDKFYYGKQRIYSCKIYDNGILVRDFVPMANEQGVCGLYDNVSEAFYTSPNGNNFTGEVERIELPDGFRKCDYIESNGKQYIDTGFVPNQNTRIDMVVYPTSIANINGSDGFVAYGSGDTSTSNAIEVYSWDGNAEVHYGSQYIYEYKIGVNDKLRIVQNKNFAYIINETKGTSWNKTFNSQTFTCPRSLYLAACYQIIFYYGNQKIYSCRIYDNDVLVRDFVPCVRQDGIVGLFDFISKSFYFSANGNNFIGKIEGEELPIGYTKCEYIESDGTQYIDTDVRGRHDIKAESEFMLMEGGASIPLGCYGPYQIYMIEFTYDTRLAYRYTGEVFTSTKIETGRKYSISVDFASGYQSMMLDGVKIASSSSQALNVNDYNIYAFAYSNTGKAKSFSKMRLYGLKLYDKDVLIRDYIPCQNSEGVYGLYDLANNVFYQSASDYGFTGKWAEDKKLLVSPSEFRRRLMMLAVNDTKPDYTILDAFGVAIMDIKGKFYPDEMLWQNAGSPTANGIAVSDGVHRFCISKDMIAKVNGVGDYPDTEYWGGYNTTVSGVTTATNIATAKSDFNGVANTDAIAANVTKSDGYFNKIPWSAAALCKMSSFPNGASGYLGACGEWQLVQDSISTINTLMSAIGGTQIDTDSYQYYWTSTQYSVLSAWYWNIDYKDCGTNDKSFPIRVRAFCTLDNP